MDTPAPPPPDGPCARPTPVDAPNCPLCGQPNACVSALTGAFSQPCWCQSATFTSALLARVPEHLRDKTCICRACAEAAASTPSASS